MASTNEKLDFCKQLGAEYGINYKEHPNFSEVVKELTEGRGVDVIQDPVLASNFDENLNSLAMDARWVLYGSMGGIKVNEANMMKLLVKRASLIGSTLRNQSDEYKAKLFEEMYSKCRPKFQSGEIKPIMSAQFRLSEVSKAHDLVE